MNAEIVHRLEQSFASEPVEITIEFNAATARQLAAKARDDLLANAKLYAQKEISKTVRSGLRVLSIDLKELADIDNDHELDETEDKDIYDEYIYPLLGYLSGLGFKVDLEDGTVFIRF